MPKDKNNGREMTPDEKFRSFFSTTAVDIPEEMTRREKAAETVWPVWPW